MGTRSLLLFFLPACAYTQCYTAPTLPGQVDILVIPTVRCLHTPTRPELDNIFFSNYSDPSGKQLATLMGPADCWPYEWPGLTDNNLGGKMLHFRFGVMVSHDDTSPFLVYGKFAEYWKNLGGIESGFGYPIADPQFLPDGSTCIIFQGGHIHQLSASRDPEA